MPKALFTFTPVLDDSSGNLVSAEVFISQYLADRKIQNYEILPVDDFLVLLFKKIVARHIELGKIPYDTEILPFGDIKKGIFIVRSVSLRGCPTVPMEKVKIARIVNFEQNFVSQGISLMDLGMTNTQINMFSTGFIPEKDKIHKAKTLSYEEFFALYKKNTNVP